MKTTDLENCDYMLVPSKYIKMLHNHFKGSWTVDSHRDVQNLIWLMIEESEEFHNQEVE